MTPSYNSPTLAPPPITATKFKSLLKTKNSPAVPESDQVFQILVDQGVDTAFALAQFRVESQYGTAGYAKVTGSWGNMLYDSHLTTHAVGIFAPGNGYSYATYRNYVDAITDYCTYIHWYKDQYGLDTIYGATARWTGKTPGSTWHLNYIYTIISDMTEYEFPEGTFYEVGDKMIYGGEEFDRDTGQVVYKYPVNYGDTLYKGTDGTVLKTYKGVSGKAWFLGPVQGSWDWGMVCIGTSAADPDATWCYIKKPDPNKRVKV